MATLALAAVGSAIGGALLPAGVSVLGATLSGAAIGQAIGAAAGSFIDQALLGSSGKTDAREGPRLNDLQLTTSTEGEDIPRLYGRARLGGQIIWATRFEEEIVATREGSGRSGKGGVFGGSSGGSSGTNERIDYLYYANFAVALCEGEITRVGRIWADGKELDLSQIAFRVYRGTETQLPDALIAAKEGAGLAPAYRGTAYVVFERLPLRGFGNRVPQLSFEVFRSVDGLETRIKAVTIIPSAGEFVYAQGEVYRATGLGGGTIVENVHTSQGLDWTAAIDQLEDVLPAARKASLFVSWFGDDLRCGTCRIRPRVEAADRSTSPVTWSAGGVGRAGTPVVSSYQGAPAFGGTPSDASVVAAIQDLKARGFAVVLAPFLLMDVPNGNALPDPYRAGTPAGQSAYPWRGRITVSPAPGIAGSPDKTASAATQITSFVGTAAVADFAVSGTTVTYSGSDAWSYRRFVLHLAHLAKAAGGVDAFLLGSELRGLTAVRDTASHYPFVDALVALAADVKSVLAPFGTKVSYAADWSEYFGHQPADGSGDVLFHLDPLWSSASVDFIGIDCYWPLSDWRDGDTHLDRIAGAPAIHDVGYLKSNITGGEGFAWYYASQAARDAQTRTAITDGAYAKPWVYRTKDIKSWWLNQHFDRPGGVEAAIPTAWVPQSKPFWFTELGCPAVDKGANQPNVFIDAKSSESLAPYYSRRLRDDLIQRSYLAALHEFLDPTHPDFSAANNPLSGVYGGRMVDPDRLYCYTWDARPYPAFPFDTRTWIDGVNWQLGHWLTGRMGGAALASVVAKILQDFGFTAYAAGGLTGIVEGYVVDRIMTARAAIDALELAYFFDSYETGGVIAFRHRGRGAGTVTLDAVAHLVEARRGAALYTLTRRQETELPVAAKLRYVNGDSDYKQAAVESRRLGARSSRVATARLPIVMGQTQAQAMADSWLMDTWSAREEAKFTLPPSRLALEPTDVVTLVAAGRNLPYRITGRSVGGAAEIEALSIEPDVYSPARAPMRGVVLAPPPLAGPALGLFLDLPLLGGGEIAHAGWVGAHQEPWPGGVAFHRSAEAAGYVLDTLVTGQATTGATLEPFSSGPAGRFDHGNRLRVKLDHGELVSVTPLALLNGANTAALQNADGEWEVVQFQNAALVGAGTYDLTVLLRGQAGSEAAMRNPVGAGARFVLLSDALEQAGMARDEVGRPFNWKFGPANRDYTHQSYTTISHIFRGTGLRPLSPAHVRGRRMGDDLTVSWIRRTRIGGDSWEQLEVPLGEDAERYDVEILNGASVVRVLSATTPEATYSAPQQQADFGAVQPSVSVRVFQVSPSFGRGTPSAALV